MSLLLWLDVAVQLRTARGAPGGRAVPSWRPAFDAYATAWLLPDLVSVLPFGSAVAARAAAAGAAPAVSLLKLGKAARMLRARHLWEGRPGGAAAGAAPAGPLTRLLALMAVFLLMTHWGACAMWALSRWQVEDGGPGCGVSAETGLAPLALFDGRLARNVTYGADANAAQALVRRRMSFLNVVSSSMTPPPPAGRARRRARRAPCRR